MGYTKDAIIISPNNTEVLHVLLELKVYEIPLTIIRPGQFELKKIGNGKEKFLGTIYLDTHRQLDKDFIWLRLSINFIYYRMACKRDY